MIYAIMILFCIGIKPLSSLAQHKQTRQNSLRIRPLFKDYPNLQTKVPHQQITNLPTPIMKLANIGKIAKIENLYIKKDVTELTGRKLEFLLADANNLQAHSVLTTDKHIAKYIKNSNNHSALNKRTFACLLEESTSQHLINKEKLEPSEKKFSYEERLYKTKAQQAIGIARIGAEEAEAFGLSPYLIPEKGNNKIGNIGVINAAFELKEQIMRGIIPKPDLIYIGAETFGTAASLYLGCKLAGIQTWIMIIQENTQYQGNKQIKEYFEETNKHLYCQAPEQIPLLDYAKHRGYFIRQEFSENNSITINKINEATKILAEHEGIQLLDACAAKTFTALLQDAKTKILQHLGGKKNPTVLFWNTDHTSF